MEPLTQWICDGCGKIISSPPKGILIWMLDEHLRRSDFKIVHKGCGEFPPYSGGDDLEIYLGANGGSLLMSMLAAGPIQKNSGRVGAPEVVDLEEFADVFRRLQVPYYEEARTKFGSPELLDDYGDYDEVTPYLSDRLEEIIERGY